MLLLLFFSFYFPLCVCVFLRRLSTAFAKTKRIQLLNITFPKVTPTLIHKWGHEASFSSRSGAML